MGRIARIIASPRITAAGVAALSAAACATAPDYAPPAVVETIAAADTDWAGADLIALNASADVSAWWRSFGGAELDALVVTLNAQSLTLEAARERIAQARARTRQARAGRLPQASLSLSGGQSGSRGFSGEVDWDEIYSASLSTSWDLDVFGAERNAQAAARLSEEAAALSARSTAHLLSAEVVRAYVSAWTLSERIAIQTELAESFRETAELTDARYRAGSQSTGALDVQIARQNLASAEAALPELKASLAVQVQAIDVLLGRRPGETTLTFALAPIDQGLAPLSPRAPADLLRRRPDVAAAELSYRAALADVATARANRLPNLSLSGTLTAQSSDVDDLFVADDLIGSLTAGLVQPIFQGGRLKAEVDRTEARARELAADYADAALSAVADVESALAFEAAAAEEIDLRGASLAAAELSDQIALERYASGQATILTVLETRRSVDSERQNLLLAQQSRLNARIDLVLAVGGDWGLAEPDADPAADLAADPGTPTESAS